MIPVLVVDDEKFVREGIVQGTDWKVSGARSSDRRKTERRPSHWRAHCIRC